MRERYFHVTKFPNDLRIILPQGIIMGKCHKGKFKVNVNVEEPDGYVDIEIK